MNEKIEVVFLPVKGPAELRTIPNTLEALQDLVEGYIEVSVLTSALYLIFNEDGNMRSLPLNPHVKDRWGHSLLGNVIFSRVDTASGGHVSVTAADVKYLCDLYKIQLTKESPT